MHDKIKLPCACAVLSVLAACGGGGGSVPFGTQLDAAGALVDRTAGLSETEAVPTSGTATYRGFAGFVSSFEPITDVVPVDEFSVEILSRLTMTANFGTGAINGRMTDFVERELGPLQGRLDITGVIVPEGFDGSVSGTLVYRGPAGDVPAAWQTDMLGVFLGEGAGFVSGDMVGRATFPGDQIVYVYGVFGGAR